MSKTKCSVRVKRGKRENSKCASEIAGCAPPFAPSHSHPLPQPHGLPLWARRTFWYQPPNQKFVATNGISRIPRPVCVWVRKSATSKDGPLISNKFLLLSNTHTLSVCPRVRVRSLAASSKFEIDKLKILIALTDTVRVRSMPWETKS